MGHSLEQLQKIADDLKRQRDGLQVKLHLAKADARDEWAKLETRWEDVRTKMEAFRKEAGHTTESVSTGLGLVLDELKKGYDNIRKTM
jgi:predicted nuclease with TOPRIM domain